MKEMKEWDKLNIFYHVAKAGSITNAAKNLNITQPSISRCIKALEEKLKSRLFERESRGVTLTKEGRILLKHVSRIFLEVEAAMKFIEGKEDKPEGDLKILTSHGLSYSWLVHYMPGFTKAYPKIQPIITGSDEMLNIEDFDIAILPYIPNRPDLVQRHIATFYMRLFASREYLAEYGTPKTVEDLKNHRFIAYGQGGPTSLGKFSWLSPEGYDLKPSIQINSANGRLKLAQLGMGITELGKDYPTLENIDLVEVMPELKGATVDFYCIYQKTMGNSMRILSLPDYLEKTLKEF